MVKNQPQVLKVKPPHFQRNWMICNIMVKIRSISILFRHMLTEHHPHQHLLIRPSLGISQFSVGFLGGAVHVFASAIPEDPRRVFTTTVSAGIRTLTPTSVTEYLTTPILLGYDIMLVCVYI